MGCSQRFPGFLVHRGSGSPEDNFPPTWDPRCPIYEVISWEGREWRSGGVQGVGSFRAPSTVSDFLSSSPERVCVPRSLQRAGPGPLTPDAQAAWEQRALEMGRGGAPAGGGGRGEGRGGLPLASIAICWPYVELQSPAKANFELWAWRERRSRKIRPSALGNILKTQFKL